MKRLILFIAAVAAAVLVAAPIAQADNNPCGGDGRHYAQHHIAFLAKQGLLGGGGHVPGTHQGFSLCNPSGN